LGIDIVGFIRFLREGDVLAALERIKKDNPFPEICGRICPAPCEQACVFYAEGAPIAIRELERFAADAGPLKSEKQATTSAGSKKVAIIGCGPAGMCAAYYLVRANFSVTVFEAAAQTGGVLRYLIPEFRLPQKVLDEQISRLKALGVEIRTNEILGRTISIDEIFMKGFSAVLLATGAALPRFSSLPGSDLSHVYYDVEFLSGWQHINKHDVLHRAAKEKGVPARTVVLGHGPAAFDAARMSLRLGSQVDLVFAGLEEQLGVSDEVIKESAQEGLSVHCLQAVEIVGDDHGFVRGVKCLKLDMVEGEHGLKLQASDEAPAILEAQCVIIANGYRAGDSLKIDPRTGMTSKERIFACGSVVKSGSVAEVMAGAKVAAQKIIQYLA
jgi:glutamate synthase (NADPH/NADH) small chain